jgi:hypothetical protein
MDTERKYGYRIRIHVLYTHEEENMEEAQSATLDTLISARLNWQYSSSNWFVGGTNTIHHLDCIMINKALPSIHPQNRQDGNMIPRHIAAYPSSFIGPANNPSSFMFQMLGFCMPCHWFLHVQSTPRSRRLFRKV